MKSAKQSIQFSQASPGQLQTIDADVIVETPVSLTVNGDIWLTFMCTPVDLENMAVGFLFNEGVIQTADEVVDVRLCANGDNVDVWLNHSVEKPDKWRRTSGCSGGLTSVMSVVTDQLMTNGSILDADQVGQLISQLFESQQLYRDSGGVHTSALTDGRQTWIVAEDIGRHNTLDKIAGRCLLERINLPSRIILTTGRISSEMLQKSARLKASIVISRTSPSSLSIEMARKWGITLIGYARRNRFNIYTHPERVLFALEKENAEQEPIFM